MAEQTWPDGNDLERAPEEAEIEAWLEESGVYLTIPSVRRRTGRRCEGRRDVGAKADETSVRRLTAVRADLSRRGWISSTD